MKTDREKLIELLDYVTELFRHDAWENTDKIADYLIRKGVTIPVRCKDCKYSKFLSYCSRYECLRHDETMKYSNDYCSFGERKND